MLTLREQISFLKENSKQEEKIITAISKQFGDMNREIFIEKINHKMFCYSSVLNSLEELEKIKKAQK